MRDRARGGKRSTDVVRAATVLLMVGVLLVFTAGCGTEGDDGSEYAPSQDSGQEVGLYPVTSGVKMGYMDDTGALAIPARYVEAAPFSGGMAAVRLEDNGLWGYIDSSGQLVIEPQFADASLFSEGLAAVRIDVNGSWGYADATGALVIAPQFAAAYDFSEGLARVRNDQTSGYVDYSGEWVISMSEHQAVGEFSGERALVFDRTTGLYGYIDREGNIAIEPTFSDAWSFSEDLAAVRLPGAEDFGYIDREGDWLIDPQFADARPFSEGRAAVQYASTATWGYVDAAGTESLPGRWDLAEQFKGGVARVGLLVGGTDGTTGALLWGYAYVGLDGGIIWRDQAYAAFTAPGATTTTFPPDPIMPEVGGTPTTVLVP